MGTERVRGAHRRVRGDERDRLAQDRVVGVGAHFRPPDGAEDDGAEEGCGRGHVGRLPAEPRGGEDGRDEQRRRDRRRVVRAHGRLRHRGREQVETELGERSDERERRGERQEREREHEPDDVAEVTPVERRRLVAALEGRRPGRGEVGYHDEHGEESDAPGGGGDPGAASPIPRSHRVPDPDPGDGEADVLLRRERRGGEEGERDDSAAVEEEPRGEQQRRREGDGVEVADRQPLHGRVEEVRDRQRGRRPGGDMPAREQVERGGAGRDGGRLHHEQQLGRGPDPPERRERGEDRVEVRAEAGDLLAADVRDGEDVAVRGRPDRLRHVPQVEAAALEGAVAEDGQGGEEGGEGDGRCADGAAGRHPATARSSSSRQRRPSTSSLACAR